MAPRTGTFRTQSESSDFFNELVIVGDGEPLIVKESGLPAETEAVATFDPAVNVGSALSLLSNGSAQPPATVEIWVDDGDGVLETGSDTLYNGSSQLLTDTTWEQLVAASEDGTKNLILAVDDDGIDDGDYNDIIVDVTISQPETPPQEVCEVSEVTFSFKSEDSGYSNVFVVNPGEGQQAIAEFDEGTEVVSFDRTDTSLGNFLLDTGVNPDAARVQIWVDDGDKEFNPDGGDVEFGSYIPVSELTWQLLADASAEGTKDVFLAFDDDGADLDGDFNDMVILADFTEPVCETDDCVVSNGSFYTVSEDSGYFNTLVVTDGEWTVDVAEDGSSGTDGWVWFAFDGESTEPGAFSLTSTSDGSPVDSSQARVQLFVDLNANGELDDADGDFVFESALSSLTWADVVSATSNGEYSIFLAIDDDGANIDGDYNDIVVKFAPVPCETDCGCDYTEQPIYETAA